MTREEMMQRTKRYGLRTIKAAQAVQRDYVAKALGSQLLRSGTSVGANYRSACRAKSPADFVNKLKIVEEECDESIYWMEMLIDSGLVPQRRLASLMKEGNEILAITVASIKTARVNAS